MAVFSGNGSNTAPSFTFSSETNSGFYRPTTNELGVAINGSVLSRWTTSGLLVGDVSTQAIGATLHARTNSAVAASVGRFQVTDTSTGDSAYLNISADPVNNKVSFDSTGSQGGSYEFLQGGGLAISTSTSSGARGFTIYDGDTSVVDGQNLGAIDFYTNDASANGTGVAATLRVDADGAFTGAGRPTRFVFNTYASGVGAADRVAILNDGDIIAGGDVAGGNPQYRYDASANRHLINAADGSQASAGGTARLVTRAGGLRIQGATSGAGAWEVVPFSLAASATATNIMSIDTSLANTSDYLYGFSGFLSIQAGWDGATNNGNRVRLYYFTQIQGNFSTTLLDSKTAGTSSDYTLTTTNSTGDRFFQLANNSASYTMRGSMAILLLGGTINTFSITDRFN